MLTDLLKNPILRGAITGFLVAARIDYLAFKNFQSPTEAKAYDWKIAAWRWFQGAVIGALSTLNVF